MCRIKTKNAGESIVEVMVAMAVSSLLIMGAIELIGRSYTIVGETNKRIEAMTLAREGVEVVRNLRDTNWLKYSGDRRKNWMKSSASSSTYLDASGTKFIQPSSNGEVDILNSVEAAYNVLNGARDAQVTTNNNPSYIQNKVAPLRLHRNSDGILTNDASGGKPSPYYRTIQVTAPSSVSADKKVTVDSEVFWKNEGQTNFEKVHIKTDLYDFYEID